MPDRQQLMDPSQLPTVGAIIVPILCMNEVHKR